MTDLKRWRAFRAEADPILDQYWTTIGSGRRAIQDFEEYSKWLKELEPIIQKYFPKDV